MIKLLKKLFFETKLTWKKLILFSLLCGIIPGLLMIPDALDDTSLQMPGINFEFWIFSALFIILNCRKPLEAGTKTFVFFLISQPLIYLVQVPFSPLGWSIFGYYPKWGIITLLTFPAGMLARYIKKNNIFSVLIFSAANALLCLLLCDCTYQLITKFPRYILSCVFIAFQIITFPFVLFKKKNHRIVSFCLAAVFLLCGVYYILKMKLNLPI